MYVKNIWFENNKFIGLNGKWINVCGRNYYIIKSIDVFSVVNIFGIIFNRFENFFSFFFCLYDYNFNYLISFY